MNAPQTMFAIPAEGENPDHILEQIRRMKQEDVDWKGGSVWSLVYKVMLLSMV